MHKDAEKCSRHIKCTKMRGNIHDIKYTSKAGYKTRLLSESYVYPSIEFDVILSDNCI